MQRRDETAAMTQSLEGHTVHRYDGELNNLHLRVLEMGGLVLDQVRHALRALQDKDTSFANTVLEREHEVDNLELGIDDDVITMIAKRGPVARDLRVIMSISKTITDLERVGDEAARIGHIAKAIYESERSAPSGHLMRDVIKMAQLAVEMLQESLASFDSLNPSHARALVCRENELDFEFQSSLRRLATFLLEDARNVGHAIHVVLLIKSIERIGDHARNIAEYVIYMVRGEDVRHRLGSYCESEETRNSETDKDSKR
jgi:phosphate transport system protein